MSSVPGMIGSIDHYHRSKSFANYVERFEVMCKLNKVASDADKLSWFISVSGEDVFDEIKLIFPKQEVEKLEFKEVVKQLKGRFDKAVPAMMYRFDFYNRFQLLNESSENFVLSVKLLAEDCNFNAFKDEALRDKLVMGIKDKRLQHKLLEEEDLSLAQVEKMVINTERAEKRAQQMGENRVENVGATASVLAVHQRLGPKVNSCSGRYRSRSRSRDRGHERRGRDMDRRGREVIRERRDYDRRSHNRNHSYDRSHSREQNYYNNAICNYCKRKGHIKRFCDLLAGKQVKRVNFVEEDTPETKPVFDKFNRIRINNSEDDESEMQCMKIGDEKTLSEPCLVDVRVHDKFLEMEVDTGSAVAVISQHLYEQYFNEIPLKSCNKRLVVVNGSGLEVLGQISVEIGLNKRTETGNLVVLRCLKNFTPLLGRDWLDMFYPGWKTQFLPANIIGNLDYKSTDTVLGYQADLTFKSEQPIFKKAYQVPYKIKDKFNEHLDMLERQGVITPIKASEWASPVIAIVKKDGDLRMVIDCKVSLNKILIPNTYPLPLAQDVFASLADSQIFCSLDLTGAYTQLELSQRSRKFVVINTPKGLYTYNRLPQGASPSASEFQQIMDQILRGLERVCCYLDDVLIAGRTYEECLDKLEQVLQRLSDANISVNFKKCKFFVTSLPYLGHIISDKGILPSPEKISTIAKAKVPQNVTELKAYLGLINYYNKFVPNLSEKLRHLYNLLQKNVKFEWSKNCDEAFNESKNCLLNAKLLTYYDPRKPLVVVTDASSYGLGGVLAQMMNGAEKPVCFTSFSLNSAQKRYPILHLEALALVCVIKKFHKFLFGQNFKVFTDHKPLIGIFGKEGKNSLFVTRIQRYILELSIYDFEIEYRPGSKMANADFCSRFPLDQKVPTSLDQEYINSLNYTNEFPIDFTLVSKETENDKFLKEILNFVTIGWPKTIPNQFRDFSSQREKLEVIDGVLLLEDRAVIPSSLREKILQLLHLNHGGMVKMKKLARRTVYWPGLNSDIEDFVKSCESCSQMEVVRKPEASGSWIPTTRPFSRLHADFFFFQGNTFLLIVDSNTKWLEVEWMRFGTNARLVNKKFAAMFTRFGLPDVIVTDGGPPFNSTELIGFLEQQGIKVLKSPPYNPASNGQAERMVRVVKDVLKKFLIDNKTKSLEMDEKLNLFLINYRNGSLNSEGLFPSERVFKYTPKTLLDLINPTKTYKHNLAEPPAQRCVVDTEKLDPPNELDKIEAGDKLLYKNSHDTFPKWVEAQFIKKVSKNVFQIQIGRHVATAHRHQLKALHVPKRGSVKMCFAANSYKRNFSSIDDDGGLLGHSRDYAVYRKQRKVDNESRSPVRTRSRARLENQQGHN
ncbi:uncharacterized protein K02A2.6-like isoform X2 [Culex pipiens pallens]|uniref:uncharacterized protein K02A2.6-like isoform X2 n=1 Tax=Culex pipiens pallens TaxID=42434 RepID=UPI0019546F9E|nr:uncharacterized protein K02A2.6-like isoform X2 [Culex pipiens pallens]